MNNNSDDTFKYFVVGGLIVGLIAAVVFLPGTQDSTNNPEPEADSPEEAPANMDISAESGVQEKNETFDKAFMNNCNESGEQRKYCGCVLEDLKSQYTYGEMIDKYNRDPGGLVKGATKQCIQHFNYESYNQSQNTNPNIKLQ